MVRAEVEHLYLQGGDLDAPTPHAPFLKTQQTLNKRLLARQSERREKGKLADSEAPRAKKSPPASPTSESTSFKGSPVAGSVTLATVGPL